MPLGGELGAVVFARQVGAGAPLVLLHGLLVSGEMFDPVVELWSMRRRLIVPDLRGHGHSAGMAGPYTVDQLATDVVALLDTIGVPRADVLGYSQGGAVAQQLARDHPDRVGRLVLVCTYAFNLLSRRERVEGVLASWLLGAVGAGAMTRLVARGGGGPPLTGAQLATLRRMLAANDRRRAVAAHRAMLAFDSRGWLSKIAAPTLVVRGAADSAVPRRHAEMLARGISDAQLRVVHGAGHLLAWTHTGELVELVESWLSHPPHVPSPGVHAK